VLPEHGQAKGSLPAGKRKKELGPVHFLLYRGGGGGLDPCQKGRSGAGLMEKRRFMAAANTKR
jgi:hypothetical protein